MDIHSGVKEETAGKKDWYGTIKNHIRGREKESPMSKNRQGNENGGWVLNAISTTIC